MANTGYQINPRLKMVSNDEFELPLDVNLNYTGVSGLPQQVQIIDANHPLYKILSDNCPLPTVVPDQFFFIDVTDANLSTMYVSNNIQVLGISAPSPVSVENGEYQKNNDGVWTTLPGTAMPSDFVKVRKLSSGNYTESVSTKLTIGGVSDYFDVKTKDYLTPNIFIFTDVTDANVSTLYISNLVFISGLSAPAPVSVVGGEYQIDNQPWTSAAGFISNGQSLRTRITSSASFEVSVSSAVTVGTYTDSFDILTKANPVFPARWVVDPSTAYCITENIVINNFDFLVARYIWDYPAAGQDMDIRVRFEDNSTPAVDNIYVGYGGPNPTLPPNTVPEDQAYLWWGLDDTNSSGNPQGIEGVLVGLKKFKDDFPDSPNIIKVGLYCVWWGTPISGNFSFEVTTYKGGTMSKVGTNIINTGGTLVSSDVRSLNTLISNHDNNPATSYKVGVLEYNKTTDSAVLILS